MNSWHPPPQVAFMVEKQGSVATWGRGCCCTKQTETLEFGAEKGLLIEEAPTQKIGGLSSSQIYLASWLGYKVFKGENGKRNRVVAYLISSWTFF